MRQHEKRGNEQNREARSREAKWPEGKAKQYARARREISRETLRRKIAGRKQMKWRNYCEMNIENNGVREWIRKGDDAESMKKLENKCRYL